MKTLPGLALSLALLAASATQAAPTFVTFDVPGAFRTHPAAINASGAVVGGYSFKQGDCRPGCAFLRTFDGTIATFAVPGAASTTASSINASGTIVGSYYVDQSHGGAFLRTPDGTIATYPVPGALVTLASAINDDGTVAGWTSADSGQTAYVRAPDGAITTFLPQSCTYATASGLNAAGAVIGGCFVNGLAPRAFLRQPNGEIREFDAPGAGLGGTAPTSIDDDGAIAGSYVDASGIQHGFVRSAGGKMKTFDVPSAQSPLYVYGIAPLGHAPWVSGSFADSKKHQHGFVRHGDGTIKVFNAIHRFKTEGAGTYVSAMNASGAITGYYSNNHFSAHGYIRLP